MSNYSPELSLAFQRHLKGLKKNPAMQKRLTKKMEEILHDPYHYKPLRNIFKNRFRTQLGNLVLIFQVVESKKVVIFRSLEHHDEAYKAK